MFTATVIPSPHAPASLLVTALGANGEHLMAWQLPAKQGALAKRLARAIEAGKAVTVSGNVHVVGRYMNADLKRLGF